jgi:hypothetical protein
MAGGVQVSCRRLLREHGDSFLSLPGPRFGAAWGTGFIETPRSAAFAPFVHAVLFLTFLYLGFSSRVEKAETATPVRFFSLFADADLPKWVKDVVQSAARRRRVTGRTQCSHDQIRDVAGRKSVLHRTHGRYRHSRKYSNEHSGCKNRQFRVSVWHSRERTG